MKTHLVLLLGILHTTLCFGAPPTLNEALQKGLFEEEAKRNLDGAIAAYQELVTQFDADKKIAATAIFRLGECYRKQGNTNDAVRCYDRLVRDFSDETTLVSLSRQNLLVLRPEGSSVVPGAPQLLITDTETAEIQRVKGMVKNSPDLINARDGSGETPLYSAAMKGHLQVARFLLDHGADPRRTSNSRNIPLHAAVGNLEMAELLLDHKSDPNAKNEHGRTPLHIAAVSGFKAMAELLIARKADVNARDNGNFTPLHLAAEKDFVTLVQLLLEKQADPAAMDQRGNQPLHAAVSADNRASTAALLDGKAEVNSRNAQGKTALHVAIEHGHIQLVFLFRSKNANFKIADTEGNTPLHLAASRSEIFLLETVLQQRPSINQTNRAGYTPLHLAISSGLTNNARLLLSRGADINAKLSDGRTPLHMAARGDPGSVALLLAHKADPNVMDASGQTPISIAQNLQNQQPGFRVPGALSPQSNRESEQRSNVITLLRSAGANENLQRLRYISVLRPHLVRTQIQNMFHKQRENLNQFSFLELVATFLESQGLQVGQLDFKRATLDRISGSPLPDVNLRSLLTGGACSNDFRLEWGDRLEIPDVDSRLQFPSPGFNLAIALTECLKRTVTLTAGGATETLVLTPNVFAAGQPQRPPSGIPSFWLHDLVKLAPTVRPSSDRARVQVTRTDPVSGKKWQKTFDLTQPDASSGENDLWLRDGDVITIPDKK